MKLYRMLTGPDDSSFCHRVTDALNKGWLLHGSASLAIGPDGKAMCGQAIYKEIEGTYSPDMKLSEQ